MKMLSLFSKLNRVLKPIRYYLSLLSSTILVNMYSGFCVWKVLYISAV